MFVVSADDLEINPELGASGDQYCGLVMTVDRCIVPDPESSLDFSVGHLEVYSNQVDEDMSCECDAGVSQRAEHLISTYPTTPAHGIEDLVRSVLLRDCRTGLVFLIHIHLQFLYPEG